MKTLQIITLMFVISLVSCVIDSLESFCYIKNNSSRRIAVRFSNSDTLDLNTLYEGWNTFILPNSTNVLNKYSQKYQKEFYENNHKVLYMYILDQDSVLKFYNRKDTLNMIQKSLLERKLINIRILHVNDTLIYNENEIIK